jgi:primosomal protein N' (replication factor Y)
MSLAVQIAGRSGRAKAAEVLVQTADAEAYAPYMNDYASFLREELAFRKAARYPPFVTLARILIAHKNETKAEALMQQSVEKLRAFEEVEIVGYGKAPIERIAGKYRYTILLRSDKRKPLLQALHSLNRREIEIDTDPVEFA